MPTSDMPAIRSAPPAELIVGTRPARIMVVDDEPSIVEMLRLRLQSLGATAIPVLQGAEAVPTARAQNPDIILLDIMMPDVDGFAVIQRLKEEAATQQIPVIFMTARDEIDSRVHGLDLGAHDYVTKPFNTVELIARVRAALRVKVLQDELTEKNRMLEQLATSDPLTGLPNRRTFDDSVYTEMERARRNHQPLSCLIFDIDDFKEINDLHGHQAGDEVLRQIGRVLQGRKRRTDLAARYGGEEFVWLLPGADESAAMELGEWLQRTISEMQVVTTQVPLRVTVSVGVSTYNPDAHGDAATSQLLQHADEALLEAKRSGKARVVFRELSVLPEPTLEEPGETREESAETLTAGSSSAAI